MQFWASALSGESEDPVRGLTHAHEITMKVLVVDAIYYVPVSGINRVVRRIG
jgi:hypothetical protein